MVASQGPSFTTVIVKKTVSPIARTSAVTSTVLLILKSTMFSAVKFSMLALLFDLLVSLSLLVIETALEMFPAEITSAIMVRL